MHNWFALLLEQIAATSLLQWVAAVLGIAEVLLARKNNIWLYPTGIVSVLLSIYLLLDVQLYAESALNVYYLVMSIYGWVYWAKKRDKIDIKVSYSNYREWIVSLGITILGGIFLTILLKKYTTSNVPIWDAWVSSTAWAGMWLLARRKIENWVFLNISNLFAIPLLFYKKLPLFAGLTIFLFIVACFGFFDWRKIYKQQIKKTVQA